MKKTVQTDAQLGVIAAVTDSVAPVIEELDLELVEVEFRPETGGWVLRLIIDSESGVNLDDCSAVSRAVSDLLDVEDMVGHAYRLEVSSPGLSRPLRNLRDYQRSIGRKAKLTTRKAVEKYGSVVIGTIVTAEADSVTLDVDGEKVDIPFEQVAKAKLVVEF
ncbi:MAG: ribosome maturation factor RimP [Desulfobulbaceae bacterium]|nr:ribosome maturation factor RimP [Desulfobulbaceae bacterium]